MTAKKGNPKFYPLLGAVNQYPDAYYYAPLPCRCCHNFAYGTAGGENIIHDKDSLAGVDVEAPP
ncbi:unnamed protein product, partial [marine sediment metagenome]